MCCGHTNIPRQLQLCLVAVTLLVLQLARQTLQYSTQVIQHSGVHQYLVCLEVMMTLMQKMTVAMKMILSSRNPRMMQMTVQAMLRGLLLLVQ